VSEKGYLNRISKLSDKAPGTKFRTYWTIIFIVIVFAMAFVGLAFYLNDTSYVSYAAFLAGMAMAKWQGLKNLQLLLPHIDVNSLRRRIESLDA